MHDASNCPVCSTSPTSGSMSDKQFSAFIAACRDELARLQPQFQQRIRSGGQWVLRSFRLHVAHWGFSSSPSHPSARTALSASRGCGRGRMTSSRIAHARHQSAFRCSTRSQDFESFYQPRHRAHQPATRRILPHWQSTASMRLAFFRVPGVPTLFLAVHEPENSNARNA